MSSRAARDFEAWANVDSPVSDQEQLLSDVLFQQMNMEETGM